MYLASSTVMPVTQASFHVVIAAAAACSAALFDTADFPALKMQGFVCSLRLRRIEQLRTMSAGPSTAASQTSSPDPDALGAGTLSIGSVSSVFPASKKRKRNMSVEVDKADGADSSDDDNGDADGMLDWRAKAI